MGHAELDTAARLYVQIGRLVRVLRRESEGSPIGPGGVSALVTLSRADGGLRLGQLAEEEGVSAPSLTRIVASLEAAKYVARVPDPDDGRAQRVTLTPAGEALIRSGQESRVSVLRRRVEALPAEQRERLEDALPALEALLAEPGE